MYRLVQRNEQKKGAIAAVEFEGRQYGSGASFFLGNLRAGQGPPLHTHPYPETCIVLAGRVRAKVDGDEIFAGAGDILVIGAGAPHSFEAIGDDRLDAICIHPSETFQIDWVE